MFLAQLAPARPRAAVAVLIFLTLASPALAQTNPVVEAPAAPVTPPAAETPDPNKPSGDASSAQTIELAAKPVAMITGSAKWDDGFDVLAANFVTINAELGKAGLAASGRPMTVFTETDDDGFRYQAMIPLANPPEGKDQLTPDVKLGKSPPGKAIKFQHRAAYSEIDATYEAITAYLDEKGLEAQNVFMEEYLTDAKGAEDDTLQVDIYVFVK